VPVATVDEVLEIVDQLIAPRTARRATRPGMKQRLGVAALLKEPEW
jgi:hypothetical protein